MAEVPKVSIIVPAYNVAPYLGETLDSVLAQTRGDYEIIVVNDGSTDETAQVVERYRDRFAGKLVYVWQENRGLAAARNTAIRTARGQYIALLDGDDVWLPAYLETMLGLLESDATLDLVFPNALFWGSPQFDGRDFQSVFPPNPPITVEKILARESGVFGLATMRRALVLAVGGYDESLRSSEDFDLWLRLLKQGSRFGFTATMLVKYRFRHDSLSNTGITHYLNKMKVLEKVLAGGELTASERAAAEREFGESEATLNWHLYRDKLQEQDYAGASEYLALANVYRRKFKWSLLQVGLKYAPQITARFVVDRSINRTVNGEHNGKRNGKQT
ncbi:MAG: glycosyltransferase family 2 protein [Acidobacteria bacterium]|nr:glycosyltransferase family 2 protein [Acidobacteriota bacterium]